MDASTTSKKIHSEEPKHDSADMNTKIRSEGIDMQSLSTSLATTSISSSPDTPNNPASPKSQTGEPLQTFHPFPRLPTELRLEIWTLALPPPERLYTVSISILLSRPSSHSSSPSTKASVAFKVHLQNPASTSNNHPLSNRSRSILDIGMLRTNKEARSVYLSANPSSLSTITTQTTPPSSGQGRLYFNPPKTTFYIPNYTSTIQRNDALVRLIKDDGNALKELKTQLGYIIHLATKSECFYPSVERGSWSGRGGGPSIRIFPNLETWYCVRGEFRSEAAAEEEMRRARGRLEVFRERIENDWTVPRVEMLEL